jgi:preprotein translocase subunit SecE
MSEAVKEKKVKKSWLKGLKSEFKKIVCLVKQTIAVLVISVIMCLLIAGIDSVSFELVNLLLK